MTGSDGRFKGCGVGQIVEGYLTVGPVIDFVNEGLETREKLIFYIKDMNFP